MIDAPSASVPDVIAAPLRAGRSYSISLVGETADAALTSVTVADSMLTVVRPRCAGDLHVFIGQDGAVLPESSDRSMQRPKKPARTTYIRPHALFDAQHGDVSEPCSSLRRRSVPVPVASRQRAAGPGPRTCFSLCVLPDRAPCCGSGEGGLLRHQRHGQFQRASRPGRRLPEQNTTYETNLLTTMLRATCPPATTCSRLLRDGQG